MTIPAGYTALRVRNAAIAVALPLADWVHRTVEEHGSLYGYAQSAPGHREVRGRDLAYVLPLSPAAQGLGIVRWLRHGGLLRAFTSDRFLSLGRPRPANELFTAVRLREQGVATPEVLAACVYPGTGFYRGEVLRAYHAEWTDLASYLFRQQAPADHGRRALADSALVAERLAACGVFHTDFNARNLLVREEPDFGVMVIDLEKASTCPPRSESARHRMQHRLLHSLRKLARRSDRELPSEWSDLIERGWARG